MYAIRSYYEYGQRIGNSKIRYTDFFTFVLLVLRGKLLGNLFAVARDVDLRGVVHGSAFVGGERSTFAGEVSGDVYAAGESFVLAPGGRIARDLTVAADQLILEGALGRDRNNFV